MTLAAIHNGLAIEDERQAIAVDDRGFNYGDGLFETTLLRAGVVRFLEAHLQRMREGCGRLGIGFPESEIRSDIAIVATKASDGVLKIVLTRGAGGRGYRPDRAASTQRLVTLHPLPPGTSGGLRLRWCSTQLSRNAALAGMKHLNRLEQVLAQNEWHDSSIDEGLVCDTEGELISATASNVFIVRGGGLATPDLRFCGVRGVMRSQVLRAAGELGIPCAEEPLWPSDLAEASEMFLTNAVRGIRSVVDLDESHWSSSSVASQLSKVLGL